MKWFIFIVVAAAVLLVFGVVYAISGAINKRKKPKYKTTAPDDDPKFLRDLAEKLKAQEQQTNTDDESDKENPSGDK